MAGEYTVYTKLLVCLYITEYNNSTSSILTLV